MDAVILAGGMGTRLRPLTDTRPKPLVPFMGEPFALGLLRRLATAGVTRATFLVGRDPAPFEALHLDAAALGIDLHAVTEDEPLDTAGAVRRLFTTRPTEPVIVCNGDVLTDLDHRALYEAHATAGAALTLALTRVEDTTSFGVVVCDADGRVRRFIEKPPAGTQAADTVNAGTYVLGPDVFAAFPGYGPLSFERSVFPGLLDGGAFVLGVTAAGYWQDLGTPERYLEGHRAVLDGRCDWPIAPGFARAGPALVHETATIDASADLGAGVVIGPGCRVAAGVRLAETVLHRGATVGTDAQLHRAILGEGATVGDRAVVGPDVVLGDGETVTAGTRT